MDYTPVRPLSHFTIPGVGPTLPDSQDSHSVQVLRFQDQAVFHTLPERRGYLPSASTGAQSDLNLSNSPTFNSATMYPHRSRSDMAYEGILPGINVLRANPQVFDAVTRRLAS